MRQALMNVLLPVLMAATLTLAQAQSARVPASPLGSSTQGPRTPAVNGTVEEQTGALIPAAELFLFDPTGGHSRKTVSDNSGHFEFEDVPPGHYLLRGKAEDMQTTETELLLRILGWTSSCK